MLFSGIVIAPKPFMNSEKAFNLENANFVSLLQQQKRATPNLTQTVILTLTLVHGFIITHFEWI
jgi:hypothetical protein